MKYFTYGEKRKLSIILFIILVIVILILCVLAILNGSFTQKNPNAQSYVTKAPHTKAITITSTSNGTNNENHSNGDGSSIINGSDCKIHGESPNNGVVNRRDSSNNTSTTSHHSNYGNSSDDGERNNIGDEPYNNSNNNTENNVSKGHTPSESHTNPDNQNHNSKYQHPEETPSTGDDAIPSQHKRPHDRNTSPGEKNPPKQSNTPNDNDTDKDNDTDNNDPDNEIHPTDNKRDSTQGAKPDNRLITPPHEDNWILWLVILIILLICYIIAKIMSKNGILVIWANKLDKILVIIAAILTFIAILLEDSHNLPDVRIVLYIIAGIMMLVSIIFSIISNLGHLLNIILSILAKLFVFWLINISLFMIIVVLIVSLIFKASDRNRDD